MFEKLLLLALLALVQGRPDDRLTDLHEWSDLCIPHEHHLIYHEYDCTKFYYCEYGYKHIEPTDCAPGTEFSYELQTCVNPRLANCGLPGVPPTTEEPTSTTSTAAPTTTTQAPTTTTAASTTTSTAAPTTTTEEPCVDETPLPTLENGCPIDIHVHKLLPHETNCSRFYYCVFGEKVERECAPNTYFNYEIQVCDWSWNVNCSTSDGGSTGPGDGCDGSSCGDGSGGNGEGSGDGNGDGGSSGGGGSGILPNGCPEDFHVHQLLPHETNCSRFYYCVHGNKVERECGPDTHFNPVLQVCDWPENAGCQTGDNGGGESGGGGSGGCDGAGGTTCAPGSGGSGSSTASPGDGGSGGCDGSSGTTCAPVDGGSGSSTSSPGDGGSGGGGGSGILPNGCPEDFHVHQLLPHETNCSRFYYCVFGEKVERECGPDTHFNPVLQVCDWPWNAGCETGDNGGGESGGGGSGGCDGAGGTTCAPGSGGSGSSTASPGDGGSGGCDGSSGTTCAPVDGGSGSSTSSPGDGGSGGGGGSGILPNGCPEDFHVHQLLPHETNCSRFYYCDFGEKVERECGPDTHFNPVLQVCDWPENAGCETGDNGGGSGGGGSGGCDGAGGTTCAPGDGSSSASTSAPGGGGSGGCDPTTCPPEQGSSTSSPGGGGGSGILPNGCPEDFHVHQLLPHETNCSRFYYCDFGEKVERECGPDTHFNPVLQVCDWPENAGCETGDNGGGSGGCDGSDVTTCAPGDGGSSSSTSSPGDGGSGGCDGSSGTTCAPVDGSSSTTSAPEGSSSSGTTSAPDSGSSSGTTSAPDSGSSSGTTSAPGSSSSSGTTSAPGSSSSSGTTSAPGDGGSGGCDPTTCPPEQGSSTSAPGGGGGSGILPNGCPEDFHVHQLLPHETNCSRFYYCVFGEKVERECGPDTHFNPVLQVCDWPWNAGCEVIDSGSGDGGEDCDVGSGCGDGDNGGGGDGGAGCPACPPPAVTDPCAIECNILPWAHETDCDKYWRCEGKTSVLVTCSEGLHFNPATATCDFACNANCVRDDVQATARMDGLKLFLPWDKIDNDLQDLIYKATHH